MTTSSDNKTAQTLIWWAAWLYATTAASFLLWADSNLPTFGVWAVNRVVILGTAYGLARWKRTRLAWGMFWVLAGFETVGTVVDFFTGFRFDAKDSPTGVLASCVGLTVLGLLYVLYKLPRFRPAKAADVSHVVHHHVLHGPGSSLPPGVDVTQVPVAAQYPDAVPGVVERPAIEAPKWTPAGLRDAIRTRVTRGT